MSKALDDIQEIMENINREQAEKAALWEALRVALDALSAGIKISLATPYYKAARKLLKDTAR